MILSEEIKNTKELKCFINNLAVKLKPNYYGKSIFIKPNLGGRYPIKRSENNNVEMLRLICEAFLNCGCTEIEIGHGSLHGYEYDRKYSFAELIRMSRYIELQSIKNVKLVNLDIVKRDKQKIGEITFEIPILQNKFYINLCKLKTHMETTVSLSLKNQMGMVSMENKKEMHRYDIHKYIANLGKILVPDLNIIDGMISMGRNGPHHGQDVKTNILICGDNMVEVDSLACRMVGINCNEVEHLIFAAQEGVGNLVEGVVPEKGIKKLLPACKYIKKGISLYVWPSTACSGCLFSLNKATKDIMCSKNMFKLIKKSFFKKTNIVLGNCENLIGSNKVILKNTIAIGNCTKNATVKYGITKCAFGCPPSIDEIKVILCK